MNASWKRSPALIACVVWAMTLLLLSSYDRIVGPQPGASARSEYRAALSSHLREGGRFDGCPAAGWAVVSYTIGADGALLDSFVVESSDEAASASILAGVRACAPYPVLPGDTTAHVSELFWTEDAALPAGSLAEQLRDTGYDGRFVRFERE